MKINNIGLLDMTRVFMPEKEGYPKVISNITQIPVIL